MTADDAARTVTLVLLGPGGDLLGALPPFEVDVPWWQEVDVVVDGARAWLKQVPVFFQHEAAVLGLVAGVSPGLPPPLLAAGPDGRMLLAHAPGEDRYGAGADFCALVAEDVHPVQEHFAGRAAELLAAGVPDRRDLGPWLAAAADPYRERIPGIAEVLDRLPERLAAIAACGMPDTLVHGDLHPGNVRSDRAARVLMDWGDTTVGHPALDILRLTGDLPEADAEPLISAWAKRWRATAPGCDPEWAVDLMRPVAALCAAAAYAGFLARIEPAEWPYHADDVPAALTAAVSAACRS